MSTAVCNLVAYVAYVGVIYKAVFGDPIKSASLRREIKEFFESEAIEEIGGFWDAEANGDVARAAAEEASAKAAIAAIAAREARNAIASIAAREANATREARDAVWAELYVDFADMTASRLSACIVYVTRLIEDPAYLKAQGVGHADVKAVWKAHGGQGLCSRDVGAAKVNLTRKIDILEGIRYMLAVAQA